MSTTTPTRPRPAAPARKAKSKKKAELARYREAETGAVRVIVALRGPDDSILVVDRLQGTKADPRVVARIDATEEPSNARLIAEMYAADEDRGIVRRLTREDAYGVAQPDPEPAQDYAEPVVDEEGVSWALRVLDGGEGRASRELRWARQTGVDEWQIETLRDTLAHFQSYEPFMPMTAAAVAAHESDAEIAVSTLNSEYRRQQTSPIVLNRGIREAVLGTVNMGVASLSEIAARCGRKHSGKSDTESGDTTWLQRRIGVRAEAGSEHPTPWVHTKVLALIARDGLGIAPNEVEVV